MSHILDISQTYTYPWPLFGSGVQPKWLVSHGRPCDKKRYRHLSREDTYSIAVAPCEAQDYQDLFFLFRGKKEYDFARTIVEDAAPLTHVATEKKTFDEIHAHFYFSRQKAIGNKSGLPTRPAEWKPRQQPDKSSLHNSTITGYLQKMVVLIAPGGSVFISDSEIFIHKKHSRQ